MILQNTNLFSDISHQTRIAAVYMTNIMFMTYKKTFIDFYSKTQYPGVRTGPSDLYVGKT